MNQTHQVSQVVVIMITTIRTSVQQFHTISNVVKPISETPDAAPITNVRSVDDENALFVDVDQAANSVDIEVGEPAQAAVEPQHLEQQIV